MYKELKDVVRLAEQQGWIVKQLTNNHWRFTPPEKNKPTVVTSSTPSDWRTVYNFMARMRRSGFRCPERARSA